jgi:hypothetical protein
MLLSPQAWLTALSFVSISHRPLGSKVHLGLAFEVVANVTASSISWIVVEVTRWPERD